MAGHETAAILAKVNALREGRLRSAEESLADGLLNEAGKHLTSAMDLREVLAIVHEVNGQPELAAILRNEEPDKAPTETAESDAEPN